MVAIIIIIIVITMMMMMILMVVVVVVVVILLQGEGATSGPGVAVAGCCYSVFIHDDMTKSWW